MHINKTDVVWNYAATILRVASYAFLLPFILRTMSSEMVGVWSVFMAITAFAALLDLGFSPSFTRNVTYIFSGIKTLKVTGFHIEGSEDKTIDYGLLKGVIAAMQWFYLRMAIILLLLLSSLGTYYIYTLLKTYKGEQTEIYIAWIVLCIISTYNIYTQYLDCLLQGKGLVKRSKQIVIIGQSIYLVIASIFILAHYGILAIISAQAVSVIIIRLLVSHSFFTNEIKENLRAVEPHHKKEILAIIYPNAFKIGLTSLGAFVIQKSSIVIGSLFLPLAQIASYGISMQLIAIISNLATIYTATYIPKIVQLRVAQNNYAIKQLYLKGLMVLFFTYAVGGMSLLIAGEWVLNLIGSQTHLMLGSFVLLALIISFLESNHGVAGNILLTKNEVPFFKASLIAGAISILLIMIFLHYTKMGLFAMVLAPGIAQLYNNWKWPYELMKQLSLSKSDIRKSFNFILKYK